MEFAKLSAPSLKDLFVQQLQGMILSDELPMGTQLPPERELAQQMQVSRAVVNGGLAELAQQGFLEVRPRQGTFVADYRRKGNLSTLIAIMEYQGGVLGKDEIRSILEVRRALEHLAAQRAIRYASDEALARLGDIVARIAAAQNNAQAAEAAFAFQHELALAGGNSILPLIYYSFKAPVITLWLRFCRMYGIGALCRNTETLYNYLCRRDMDGAERWIDAYLEQAIDGSQQIYEDAASVLHITDVPYGTSPETGAFCTDENVNNALDIVAGMTTSLADQVVLVKATDAESTKLTLDNGVEIAFGKAEDIREKERVCLEIMEQNPGSVAYINVRVVDRPTWRAL